MVLQLRPSRPAQIRAIGRLSEIQTAQRGVILSVGLTQNISQVSYSLDLY